MEGGGGETTDGGGQTSGSQSKKPRRARRNNELATHREEFMAITAKGYPEAPKQVVSTFGNQIGCMVRETVKITTGDLRTPIQPRGRRRGSSIEGGRGIKRRERRKKGDGFNSLAGSRCRSCPAAVSSSASSGDEATRRAVEVGRLPRLRRRRDGCRVLRRLHVPDLLARAAS